MIYRSIKKCITSQSKKYNNDQHRLISKNTIGKIGEWCTVIRYLCMMYIIVGRRVRNKEGEIDLIFQRFNSIVFVEVKTSRSRVMYSYLRIKVDQQQRIKKAARLFLQTNKQYRGCKPRFDASFVSYMFIPKIVKHAF